MRKRQNDSLSAEKRQIFIDANPLVKDWLRNKAPQTQRIFAFNFIRFFYWAQDKYGFASLEAMLRDHNASRKNESIIQRKKHARILKEYVLDNPKFSNLGDRAKALIITAVNSFYNYCEAPLTTAKGEFKFETYSKFDYKQFGVDDARRIISTAPQREKTIYLFMLQAGLRIGDVLNYVNYRWSEIKSQLEVGKDPIELSMYGGKYWTYISTDAIHEFRKYIIERGEPKDDEPIFISTKSRKSVSPVYVAYVLHRIGRELGLIPQNKLGELKEGHRYAIKLHQFRKLFKSESSVAGRGFDSRYGEFFMGHAGGLSQIGGIYDKSPELHEDIFEKEYKKIAPYLNIFTGISSMEQRLKEVEKIKGELGSEMMERMQRAGVMFRREVSEPKPRKKNAGDCEDGIHCGEEFKQINESELLRYLQEGWDVKHDLPNGEVIICKDS